GDFCTVFSSKRHKSLVLADETAKKLPATSFLGHFFKGMKERREEGKEGKKEGTREGKKVCCFARNGFMEETFSVVYCLPQFRAITWRHSHK
ncbi:MAG: hypothetical protein FWG03_02640, partial [Clostridiales bacterium]|nr:hypothetical protein [Clostridiales bacterium]